jgi:hypothetical protein
MVSHPAIVSGRQQKVTFELLSLPLYAVGELERLLEREVER